MNKTLIAVLLLLFMASIAHSQTTKVPSGKSRVQKLA
jgi:hypothetical protein